MAWLRKFERKGRKALVRVITGLFNPTAHHPPDKINSVLVLRLDERLGNVVLLNSVIRSFIRQKIRTSILVCKKYGTIYKYNKDIHEIIYFNKKTLFNPFSLFKLIFTIRSRKYDLLFDASNPNDLSTLSLFVMIMIRAGRKIGFDRKNSAAVLSLAVKQPAVKRHILEYYRILFKKINLAFYKEPRIELPESLLKKYSGIQEKNRKVIILHPGGRGLKQWNVNKMLSLTGFIDRKQYKLAVILGPAEKDIRPLFEKRGLTVFCPEDVLDLAAVLAAGVLYIGNDSGPMHLAAALGLDILAVFKPDASVVFTPLAGKYQMVVSERPYHVPVKEMLAGLKKLIKIIR